MSETFAKDKRFIRWMYDGSRDPDIRRDIRLVVSHEPVIDFFENNRPRLESRPHKYFEFMLKRGTETATIPNSLLNHYFRITEADADAFLAIYSTTIRSGQKENKHQEEGYFTADQFRYRGETNAAVFAGSAIFKRGRMIGKLTAEETRIAIELSNIAKASDVLTTFPDPLNGHYKVGVRLRKNESNSIQMNLEKKTA
ncbi:hypothetical protein RWE15_19975 [Virgibacillus halophilus]|uniref:Spore germination protein N-terminal domain-containing protein n=1 Tax=Tigheibacillus halophilus TaxID=361280 RepID=A0ABU5CA76_9BACI|nr:hypothetical protein [Virgibacillus halophilus]